MKSLVAVLVMLGLAAIPVYRMVVSNPFGVDADHPLGNIETIEAFLLERDYVKQERKVSLNHYGRDIAEKVEGAKMWQFELNPARDRMATRSPRVDVIIDSQGRVRGVGAHFYSGSLELGRSTNSVEDLAQVLWRTNADGDPVFRDAFSNEGVYSQSIHTARFANDGVNGKWRKSYGKAGNAHTIFDWVMVYTD